MLIRLLALVAILVGLASAAHADGIQTGRSSWDEAIYARPIQDLNQITSDPLLIKADARGRMLGHGPHIVFANCPQGVLNADVLGTLDGCLLAQTTGSAHTPRSTYFSPASQFILQTPTTSGGLEAAFAAITPSNVAGVDYPTGRASPAIKLDPAPAAIFSGAYVSGLNLYWTSVVGTAAYGQYVDVAGAQYGTYLTGPCTSSPCGVSISQTVGSSASPLTIPVTTYLLPQDCHNYPVGAPTYTASPYGVPMWLCQITASGHLSKWGSAKILGDAIDSGWDFSGASSTNDPCMTNAAAVSVCPSNGVWALWKNSVYSSTCTIQMYNNTFNRAGSNFNGSGGENMLHAVWFASAAGDLGCPKTILYNDYNDGFPNAYDLANPNNQRDNDPIRDDWSSNTTIALNTFTDLTARSYQGNPGYSGENFIYRYNYAGPTTLGGYGLCNTCGSTNFHGEIFQITPAQGVLMGKINADFNTLGIPSFTPNSSWAAAFALIAAQGYSNTLAAGSSVDSNTVIMNTCNSSVRSNPSCIGVNAAAVMSYGLIYMRYAQFEGLTIAGNYFAPSGSYVCSNTEGAQLVQGTLTGTTVNITTAQTVVVNSTSVEPAIFPAGAAGGSWLYSSDSSIPNPTQILGQISGAAGNLGNYTGSYNEGSGNITFPSGAASQYAEISPSFVSLTWPTSGPGANINMIDGSVITPGSSFHMNNGMCTNPYPG